MGILEKSWMVNRTALVSLSTWATLESERNGSVQGVPTAPLPKQSLVSHLK